MNIEHIVQIAQEQGYEELEPRELDELLSLTEMVFEQDTTISGMIRILKVPGGFLTQETTDKNRIVLRFFDTEAEAQALVKDHLATYEMMWDGCGCRVHYYPRE